MRPSEVAVFIGIVISGLAIAFIGMQPPSPPKHEPTNAELFEERNALVRSMNADAEDRRIETAGTVILLTCSTYALGCASSATLFLGLLQDTSAKAARVQEIDATILDRVNRGRRSPLRPVWTNKE